MDSQEEIEELKKQVETLTSMVKALYSSTTMPLDVAGAIKTRLEQDFTEGAASSVLPATYTQAVNEGGSATYNVSKPMTGFIQVKFGGVIYNVPYF